MYLSGALTAGGSPSATTSTTATSGSSHGGLSPLWGAFFVTAGILLLLEVLPWVIGRFVAKKHSVNDAYYKGLLLGTDNRLSTSKLNASLWTVVLVYFLLALAFVAGFDASTFNDLVHKVNPLYLVLIGGPFAAAILSKGIVSSAVNAGMKKDTATAPKVADFFSNDDGNTDLADTQYVLFNVIAAFIVVVEFLRAPLNGPPDIPAFLAVLTGASAAAYVTNKGVTTSASTPFGQVGTIDQVTPPRAGAGSPIKILGSNMIPQGNTAAPMVLIAGVQAGIRGTPTPSEIECLVPGGLTAGPCAVTIRPAVGDEVSADGKFEFTA